MNKPLSFDEANSIFNNYKYLSLYIDNINYRINGVETTGFKLHKNSDPRIHLRITFDCFADLGIITENGVQLYTTPTPIIDESPLTHDEMLHDVENEYNLQLVVDGKPRDPDRICNIKYKHYKWLINVAYAYRTVVK